MEGVFSHAAYYGLSRTLREMSRDFTANPALGSLPPIFGMPVQTSNAFPMQLQCPTCDGTGEGAESTYCPKCAGAGENRYEGMVRNGDQTILLTVPLPKAFEPYFPAGLVPMPQLSRGLP